MVGLGVSFVLRGCGFFFVTGSWSWGWAGVVGAMGFVTWSLVCDRDLPPRVGMHDFDRGKDLFEVTRHSCGRGLCVGIGIHDLLLARPFWGPSCVPFDEIQVLLSFMELLVCAWFSSLHTSSFTVVVFFSSEGEVAIIAERQL